MSFTSEFPPIETAMELEPEELAPFVLRYLSKLPPNRLNRYNFSLGTDGDFVAYAGGHREEMMQRLMEAWMWLEREMFIGPKPGTKDEWAFITRRGEKVLASQDFNAYKYEALLPSQGLDAVLVSNVKPLFIRGRYDTAIFEAFKEVEVRVRTKGKYAKSDLGVVLMRKAFHPDSGTLTNSAAEGGEKVATMELFAGSIGRYKNPSSHNNVGYTDPQEVSDIIHLANILLRIVDGIQ